MRYLWMLFILFGCSLIGRCAETTSVTLKPQWKAEQFSGVEAVERAIIVYSNDMRRENNLPLVTLRGEMQVAARQHSQEMGEKNYFDHYSPMTAWRTPWQRTYQAGYWGVQVGENLAALSVEEKKTPEAYAADCVKQWMASPPHRKNLLESKWLLIGVGAVQAGNRLYCTQLFAGPIFTLEQATLTSVTGELVNVKIDGTIRTGAATVWVNEQLQQTIWPKRGEFTTTVSFPRNSGTYNIAIGTGNIAAWIAKLDTSHPPNKMLEVERLLRSGVVTSTATELTPFTGVRLTGSLLTPSGKMISMLRNGDVVASFTPDANKRVTFDIILPKRQDPYIIGFMSEQLPEDLLYIDTTLPLSEAFRCRPN